MSIGSAKTRTLITCQSCGTEHARWQGQCSGCGEWNSLLEERVHKQPKGHIQKEKKRPIPITEIQVYEEDLLTTEVPELDRVLGKGLVQGSVILLGGEPGIGKSTLALQLALNVSKGNKKVLYVSGEESEKQLLLRAKRLGAVNDSLLILSDTNMISILEAIQETKPELVILDSIQVVADPQHTGTSGTVSQVRHSATALISQLKSQNTSGVIIGHITKEGSIAGPKVLEHLVDVILYFEGERSQEFRLLRCLKNRYAPAFEVGVFSMTEEGLLSSKDIGGLFLNSGTLTTPGSIISPVMQGSRAVLVELQSLVVDTGYGMAKRSFLGVDSNRAGLVLATLEKSLGLKLYTKDIFINVIGGLKIIETSMDLAIAAGILSSFFGSCLPEKTGVLGELGLTGELRTVPHLEQRLKELYNMGIRHCICPNQNQSSFPKNTGIEPIFIDHIQSLKHSLSFEKSIISKN